MYIIPSKSEVSELCAAKGPKHVDRHHICTGSQGQFDKPQTLEDATQSGTSSCRLISDVTLICIPCNSCKHTSATTVLAFPRAKRRYEWLRMYGNGFVWILWWCVPCFCLHMSAQRLFLVQSCRNVPASLTPRQFLICSKERLSYCWQRTLCVPSRTLPPPLGWSRKVQSYHQCIARRSLQCEGKLQHHTNNSQLRGTKNAVWKTSCRSL